MCPSGLLDCPLPHNKQELKNFATNNLPNFFLCHHILLKQILYLVANRDLSYWKLKQFLLEGCATSLKIMKKTSSLQTEGST